MEYKCTSCGEECRAIEERIDYSGTHCTFGRSGTHYTGFYESDCCGALVEEVSYFEEDY